MKKRRKVIHFGMLSVGLFFLLNPNVNMIDVLPDAIGYLLILGAIGKLCDLCPELADARGAFIQMFWISFAKIPALLLMFGITAANVGEQTTVLLFSFCFSVAEVVFGVRAFYLLFQGLVYLGTRRDGGAFLYGCPDKKKRRTFRERKNVSVRVGWFSRLAQRRQLRRSQQADWIYTRLTAVFFIIKFAMSVLPELTLLVPYDSTGYVTPEGMTMLNFRPVLIALAFCIALIVGLIWFVSLYRYVKYLSSHTEFWDSMAALYEAEVVPKTGFFVLRRVHIFMLLASFAALFSVDLYVDEINWFPDFLSAVLFFAAAVAIAKYAPRAARRLKIASFAYLLGSSATFATMLIFTREYVYNSVHKIERAQTLYLPYALCNAVEQIAFLATVFALATVIREVTKAHTGMDAVTEISSSSRPLYMVFSRKTVVMRVWAGLMSVMSILYFYFVVDVQSVKLRNDATAPGGYVYFPKFEVAWLVDFVIAMIFAVYTINLLWDLLSEVQYKYKYE